MNKHLLTKLMALAFVGFFQTAEAATLNLQFPNGQNIYSAAKNSIFDANIYVSNVNDLAGFDFDLTYNSTNFSAELLTTGNIFGADTVSFASTITPGVGAILGRIHFAESTLSTTGLNITSPTLLGTVKFKALNISQGNFLSITADPVSPSQLLFLSDGSGPATGVTGGTAHITAAPVPLPASVLLFASGLLAVFGVKKNKARKWVA